MLHPTIQTGGVQDQSEVEEREDVLVYTSSRLTTHRTIAGPVEVTLYASSSAPDTDFTAKLVDVEPDGYCMNLAEGILRVRYRNSIEREEFIEPGEIYQLSLDLWATAHTFQPGHRIRLEIASSNFPRFDRNMNRTEVPAETALSDAQVAHQEVLHDSEHPSHISLPVV